MAISLSHLLQLLPLAQIDSLPASDPHHRQRTTLISTQQSRPAGPRTPGRSGVAYSTRQFFVRLGVVGLFLRSVVLTKPYRILGVSLRPLPHHYQGLQSLATQPPMMSILLPPSSLSVAAAGQSSVYRISPQRMKCEVSSALRSRFSAPSCVLICCLLHSDPPKLSTSNSRLIQ